MNEYVHYVYDLTKQFPTDERFGVISQFRRAAMSIILNYIEGFARRRASVMLVFYEQAYGSLHESLYCFEFALARGWLTDEQYKNGTKLGDEIGAMLWSEMQSTERRVAAKSIR